MVRVLDAQREGHFKIPYDTERLDMKYLEVSYKGQQL
jgi:hypothetical protein